MDSSEQSFVCCTLDVVLGGCTCGLRHIDRFCCQRIAAGATREENLRRANVAIYAGDLVQAQTYLDRREWQPAIDILSDIDPMLRGWEFDLLRSGAGYPSVEIRLPAEFGKVKQLGFVPGTTVGFAVSIKRQEFGRVEATLHTFDIGSGKVLDSVTEDEPLSRVTAGPFARWFRMWGDGQEESFWRIEDRGGTKAKLPDGMEFVSFAPDVADTVIVNSANGAQYFRLTDGTVRSVPDDFDVAVSSGTKPKRPEIVINDGSVEIWNAERKKRLSVIPLTLRDRSADFMRILDSSVDRRFTRLLKTASFSIGQMASDGSLIAIRSTDGPVVLIDCLNGRVDGILDTLSGTGSVQQFSDDGNRIMTGGGLTEQIVRVWNLDVTESHSSSTEHPPRSVQMEIGSRLVRKSR